MSDTQRNIETVRGIYAAFGRGDVAAILAPIADDVDWEFGYPHNDDIPWLKSGKGKRQAASFFETLRGFEFHRFDVVAVAGAGEHVISLVALEATWKPTGRRLIEPCEAHVWRFDPSGRVVAMRHAADTRQHARIAGV
ncbi:MAG TPA: nuclear transport factor 2 family protein [Burkholderiaceae bacterium]|nr:nuclear transport factor 2 family protein [Burkholderiaceae bacterium]